MLIYEADLKPNEWPQMHLCLILLIRFRYAANSTKIIAFTIAH